MLKPSVQVHEQDGILIAEFWDCWRLDPAPVQELRSRYETHLKSGGRPEIVVDLSGVGFAGSAALGELRVAATRGPKKGGPAHLLQCRGDSSRSVSRQQLEPLFEFVADRNAAIAFFAGGSAGKTTNGKIDGNVPGGPDGAARAGRTAPSPLRRRRPDSETP